MDNNIPNGPCNHDCPWTVFHSFIYGTSKDDKCMKDNQQPGVPCVRKLLGKGMYREILEFLKKNQFRDSCYHPTVLSLATCMLYADDDECRKESSNLVQTLCNIPTKLFLLIHLLQLSAHGGEYCTKQKKRRKKKRAASSVPLRSATVVVPNDQFQTGLNLSQMHHGAALHPPSSTTSVEPGKTSLLKRKHMPSLSDGQPSVKRPKIKTRDWGKRRRQAISSFYLKKKPMTLLYQLTKCKKRYNWSHKRVLCLCHPKIPSDDSQPRKLIFDYLKFGYQKCIRRNIKCFRDILDNDSPGDLELEGERIIFSQETDWCVRWIKTLEDIKKCVNVEQLKIILNKEYIFGRQPDTDDDFAICWEHIPTQFLKEREIFTLLIENMPITSTIRNLKRMDSMELLTKPDVVSKLRKKLQDCCSVENRSACKVHPVKLLKAWIINRREYSYPNETRNMLMEEIKDTVLALLKGEIDELRPRGVRKKFLISIDLNLTKRFENSKTNPRIYNMQYGLCLLAALNEILLGSEAQAEAAGKAEAAPVATDCTPARNKLDFCEFFNAMKIVSTLPSLDDMVRRCESSDENLLKDLFKDGNFEFKKSENDVKCMNLPIEHAAQTKEKCDVLIILTESLASNSDKSFLESFKKCRNETNGDAKLVILDFQHEGLGRDGPHPHSNQQENDNAMKVEGRPQHLQCKEMEIYPGVLHLPAHDANVLTKTFKFINNSNHIQDCPYCKLP